MDTMTAIIVAVVVLAAIAGAVVLLRQQRSTHLRRQFGTEYERAVEDTGARHRAETILREREKRVQRFDIHPLSADQRTGFTDQWRRVQAEFVDDPRAAVTHADDVLGEVMEARGYPVTDFDQRSADLSVEHPSVVENYRAAHAIAERHERGDAGTEDLRQAMIHYRTLFDDLVDEVADDHADEPARRRPPQEEPPHVLH